MIATLGLVDEKRLKKLLDKEYVGKQLQKFWAAHGFGNITAIIDATKLTNVRGWAEFKAFPSWPGLVKIAKACKTDLVTLIGYIDPEGTAAGPIDIKPEHLHLHEMLATILKCENPRRIQGITVNLEEFSQAAEMEMHGESPPKKIKTK